MFNGQWKKREEEREKVDDKRTGEELDEDWDKKNIKDVDKKEFNKISFFQHFFPQKGGPYSWDKNEQISKQLLPLVISSFFSYSKVAFLLVSDAR